MKNVKIRRFLLVLGSVLLISILLCSSFVHVEAGIVKNSDATKYKFNSIDVLNWSAFYGGNKPTEWPFISQEITKEMLNSKDAIALTKETVYNDNKLDASDAARIYLVRVGKDGFDILSQLSEGLGISEDDITVEYKIILPEKSDNNTITYTLKKGTTIDNSTLKENIKAMISYNKDIYLSKKYINEYATENTNDDNKLGGDDWDDLEDSVIDEYIANGSIEERLNQATFKEQLNSYDFSIISATAYIKDGREYKLVIGSGEEKDDQGTVISNYNSNWYLVKTAEAKAEFKTLLEYDSTPEGKMNAEKTYLPPYYENEDKDAKKDVDATAFIKSKTEEEIVATNDIALTDENTKENPNELGWYYPDVTDKTVIAKDYPFDKYNNPTDNGAVKEAVRLTGAEGGKDVQEPSIAWTLRRINYEEKTNEDKSVTVTITYNLPIDEKSIPEGWKGIADEDGGIRKITRTFKEGEEYDKDVTVEQNGPSTATVTTPVKVTWGKAPEIQAGNTMNIVLASIIGLAIITVISYRKFRK